MVEKYHQIKSYCKRGGLDVKRGTNEFEDLMKYKIDLELFDKLMKERLSQFLGVRNPGFVNVETHKDDDKKVHLPKIAFGGKLTVNSGSKAPDSSSSKYKNTKS